MVGSTALATTKQAIDPLNSRPRLCIGPKVRLSGVARHAQNSRILIERKSASYSRGISTSTYTLFAGLPSNTPTSLLPRTSLEILLCLIARSDSNMLYSRSFISTIFLLYYLPFASAVICLSGQRLLPTAKDCHELIDALEYLAHFPPYSSPQAWSRHVEDSVSTRKLPKDYWLQGRGPSTCAIHIDVVPWNLDAEETFELKNVAGLGEIIVEQCLVRRRQFGLAYPGLRELVQARIVRTDAPWLKGKTTVIRNVVSLGNGTNLWEATAKVGALLNGTRSGVAAERR